MHPSTMLTSLMLCLRGIMSWIRIGALKNWKRNKLDFGIGCWCRGIGFDLCVTFMATLGCVGERAWKATCIHIGLFKHGYSMAILFLVTCFYANTLMVAYTYLYLIIKR